MKKQIFTFLGLILISVVLMAQSQNKFTGIEEHKAFKQNSGDNEPTSPS